MNDVILELQNLKFGFSQQKIFEQMSFKWRSGNIYGLFGPNGSGKTTLFNLICGFHIPENGSINYYNEAPNKINSKTIAKFKDGLARTFQVPVVVDDLTVLDNLLLSRRLGNEGFSQLILPKKNDGPGAKQFKRSILEYLEVFELKDKLNIQAGELSYGERRIVANLQILLSEARILLFDEPFANLNRKIIDAFKKLFKLSCKNENRLILLIEHPPDNLINFVDTIVLIENKRLEPIADSLTDEKELTKIIQSKVFKYE